MPPPSLRPEFALLLHCARTHVDPHRAESIKSLMRNENMDWHFLHETAGKHLLHPLLYWNLKTLSLEDSVRARMPKLETHFYNNSARNLYMSNELLALMKKLENAGVTAIPYKGPVLAGHIYGNLSLREFGDLDIFVKEADIFRAREIAIAEGYSPMQADDPDILSKDRYNLQFVHHEKRVHLEIHWKFTRNHWVFRLNYPQMWARMEKVSFAGKTVPHFSPEDLFLILCMHATKHRWERLIWTTDLAEIIRAKKQIDWSYLFSIAKESGSTRVLHLGLTLAMNLLDAELPPEIAARIQQDQAAAKIAQQVTGWLLDAKPLARGEGPLFYIHARERLREKFPVLAFYVLNGFTFKTRKRTLRIPPMLRYLRSRILKNSR